MSAFVCENMCEINVYEGRTHASVLHRYCEKSTNIYEPLNSQIKSLYEGPVQKHFTLRPVQEANLESCSRCGLQKSHLNKNRCNMQFVFDSDGHKL